MEKTRARRQRRRRRRRHHFLRLSVCLSLSLAKMRASNEPNDEEDEEGGKRGEALSFSVCALTKEFLSNARRKRREKSGAGEVHVFCTPRCSIV